MLQCELFGRALDLSKKIPETSIKSGAGASAVIDAIYKRDPLAVVGNVFQVFLEVLHTKRGSTETYKNFESRFEVQVSKFNSLSKTSHLPDSLISPTPTLTALSVSLFWLLLFLARVNTAPLLQRMTFCKLSPTFRSPL